jgi:hypothetical protein
MLDWPAKINTLRGLAKERGDRAHNNDAIRIIVGFNIVYGLNFSFLGLLSEGFAMKSHELTGFRGEIMR